MHHSPSAPRSPSSPWACPTTSPLPSKKAAPASGSAPPSSANASTRRARPPKHDALHSNSRNPRRLHPRSEEHTSDFQSRQYLVCRLLLEKKQSSITIGRFPLPSHRYTATDSFATTT